jgi:hypothetical protein
MYLCQTCDTALEQYRPHGEVHADTACDTCGTSLSWQGLCAPVIHQAFVPGVVDQHGAFHKGYIRQDAPRIQKRYIKKF